MDEPALLPVEEWREYAKPNFEYLCEKYPGSQRIGYRYDEYVQACKRAGGTPYGQRSFKTIDHRWRKERGPKQNQWNPGEILYCETRNLTSKQARNELGGLRCLFVAVSPYSECGYACAIDGFAQNPRYDLWMSCCIDSYRFFGGVYRATFCPIVRRVLGDKCQSVYHTMHAFASHYGTVLFCPRKGEAGGLPCQPELLAERHEWDICKFFKRRLRDLPWLPTEDLNKQISELLKEYNEGINVRGIVRREDFENSEAPELLPLPAYDYDMSIWRERKVKNDYHFEQGGFRYSVPFQYARKTVLVRISEDVIEAYSGGELIARHRLADESDGRRAITDPSHRPDSHKAMANRLRVYFMKRAREVGPGATAVMKELLAVCGANDGSHRPCKDLLDLRNTPSELTLEEACSAVVEKGMEKTVPAVSNMMRCVRR
ncbi:MAG: hypothetical protein IKL97_06040 [Eggerthellaceae bacterium]|nr:hypothetical protein [Eggerthellaceae bacterium]